MWAKIKDNVAELRRARRGERFRACYRRLGTGPGESYTTTVVYVSLGVVAIVLGVVFAFWPVIPGFVFVLAGLVLVSARSHWVADRLDRLELALWRRLPRAWRARSAPQTQRRER